MRVRLLDNRLRARGSGHVFAGTPAKVPLVLFAEDEVVQQLSALRVRGVFEDRAGLGPRDESAFVGNDVG